MKNRLFPGVAFRGIDWDRRAWLIGTALDVWEIATAYQDFDSVERMAAKTDLSERQIRLAMAYYKRFPVEIDDAIRRNRRALEDLQTAFPTIDVSSVPTR